MEGCSCCPGHGHGHAEARAAAAPRQARPKPIRAVLCDLSGTIHVQEQAIPGAVAAIKRLSESGIAVRFVTNTTKQSVTSLHSELSAMGFDIDPSCILSSPVACRKLLEAEALRPLFLVDPRLLSDFAGVPTEDPNCVIVGLAPSECTYGRLNEAFRLLMRGAKLIALHRGRYYREKTELSLGPGPFVAGLEMAAGVEARVVGKPSKDFFTAALRDVGAAAEEAAVIGDDVEDDVAGGAALGMHALLVRTGKFTSKDEGRAAAVGAAVVADVAAAVEWLLARNAALAAADAIGKRAVVDATRAALEGAGPAAVRAVLPDGKAGGFGGFAERLWGSAVVESAGRWALDKGDGEQAVAAALVAGLAGEGAALSGESVQEGVTALLAAVDDLCIEVPAAYGAAGGFVRGLVAAGALPGAALQRALRPLVRIGEAVRFLADLLPKVRAAVGDAGLRERCAGLDLAAVLPPSVPREAAVSLFLREHQLGCLRPDLALEARLVDLLAAGAPAEAALDLLAAEGVGQDAALHSRLLNLLVQAAAASSSARREAALGPAAPQLDPQLYARYGPHLQCD